MKRVLIIGSPGAGKTFLSKQLAEKLKLPLIHLDHLYYKPDWVSIEKPEFDKLLQVELEKDSWIMDGNYNRTIPHRIKYADTVICLDYGRWICAWRAIKRCFINSIDQAEGCPQKIDFKFLKYILWDHYIRNSQRILDFKNEHKDEADVVHLKTQKDSDVWLSNVVEK